MKILFTSEAVLEDCNGIYHSNNLKQQIARYQYLGDVVCVCYRSLKKSSKMHKLEKELVEFVFAQKENSLKSVISTKKANDQLIKKQVEKCDMLVAHVPSTNSYHAIKWARKLNKPYFVVVVGCAWDAHWNYDWRGKLLAPLSYNTLKKVVRQSSYALYVTESFLQKRYPCKGVVEHASNVCITECDDNLLSARLAKIESYRNGQEIKIVTSAQIDVSYKGQEYVIRALAELNKMGKYDYHYYMIGAGDESYLLKIAEENDVVEKVHFLGCMSHTDVISTLDEMDLYIQPSKQEGLPRALIEGMSRALPAVGTRVAGIPELLSDDYLVKKGSVDEIVRVLSTKMDKESMKKQAEANFKKASEYTLDIINARRQKFFDTFINDNFSRN